MKNYQQKANQARKKVLEMVYKAQTSHIASNFSCIDIATVLYENLKEGDEVVWSKGWVAATIYYFLAKQGKIPVRDLDKFPKVPYLGLAETSVKGVHVSGGSMGHGLPIAVGMALGKKMKGEKGMIYCIMSDGELNEGTTWESVSLAGHHKLNNLTLIIDANGWQAMGRTKDIINYSSLEQVFFGFRWGFYEIDGHNHERIDRELLLMPAINHYSLPKVLYCNTVKGKGVSFMENHLTFHYKNVDKETYELALKELENA